MNKKNLFYWSLYDFSNSIVFINFLLYFSQWIVIEGGLSDFWYNFIFAFASLILFFSAPTLASYTDKFGGRKYFITLSTAGTVLGYLLAVVFAYLDFSVYFSAIFFMIGQYFYQLSFVFHNPMIEDISEEKERGKASGICQFSNSLGQVVGLLIAIPFSDSRLQPLIPSIIIFVILSLPFILFFKESKSKTTKYLLSNFTSDSKKFFNKFYIFFSTSVVIPVLISFFFFNDALITISNNYSIYLERVFGIPDFTKNIIMMIILAMSALGGLFIGKLSDKIGSLKTLKIILLFWILLLPALAIVEYIPYLVIFSGLLGLFMGGIITVTRAYLSIAINKEELGYTFSFYTIFERFATFFGPLTWGTMIGIIGTEENDYRITMMTMVVYIVFGFLVIQFWNRNKTINQNNL